MPCMLDAAAATVHHQKTVDPKAQFAHADFLRFVWVDDGDDMTTIDNNAWSSMACSKYRKLSTNQACLPTHQRTSLTIASS